MRKIIIFMTMVVCLVMSSCSNDEDLFTAQEQKEAKSVSVKFNGFVKSCETRATFFDEEDDFAFYYDLSDEDDEIGLISRFWPMLSGNSYFQSLTLEELLETTSQDALGSFCNYSEVRAYFPCPAMQNPMEYQEFVCYYSNQTQTVSGVISSESVHWVSNRLCFDSDGLSSDLVMSPMDAVVRLEITSPDDGKAHSWQSISLENVYGAATLVSDAVYFPTWTSEDKFAYETRTDKLTLSLNPSLFKIKKNASLDDRKFVVYFAMNAYKSVQNFVYVTGKAKNDSTVYSSGVSINIPVLSPGCVYSYEVSF